MLIRNFLFHRVGPGDEKWALPLSNALFEKCIRYIVNNFQVRAIEEIVDEKNDAEKNDEPVATISFDDGFKDTFLYAAPILKKYNCVASIYIVTECIDQNKLPWTYELLRLFNETRIKKLVLNSNFLNEDERSINFSNAKARSLFGMQLLNRLSEIPFDEGQNIIRQIQNNFSDVAPAGNFMMTWDDVKTMQQQGFHIGSHTSTHPYLTTLASDDQIISEAKTSMNRINEKCGIKPISISYPMGNFNERVTRLCQDSGYKLGLAVGQQFYDTTAHNNTMSIPRVDVYSGSGWFKTFLRLTGDIEKIKKLVRP